MKAGFDVEVHELNIRASLVFIVVGIKPSQVSAGSALTGR
jgi:hypothetical protein